MINQTDIAILGAGSYGTALAITIARNGNKTLLWGHDSKHIKQLIKERVNNAFLPKVNFPDNLQLTTDLKQAANASNNLLIVVPSFAFREVIVSIKPLLSPDARLSWATKGLDPKYGQLLQEVIADEICSDIPLAAIAGPTFAKELAAGLPTAIAVAGNDINFAKSLVKLLHNEDNLRVYINDDFIGLQLGGAVKNVIAISAGLADGLGFGANARTALITRGIKELARLGAAIGAKNETFMGMAGLGDLVLTCTDNQSRNRRFGIALGQGQSIASAQQDIGQIVEGIRNTEEVYKLAKRKNVEMPICEQVYQVLYQGKSPNNAASCLLARLPTRE